MTRISTAAATAGRAHNHSFDPGPISGRQKQRLRLILTVVLISFLGVIGRLSYLHCINRDFLLSQAQKQRSIVVPIPSRRGDILDRHHRKLASTVDAKSLHAFPERVRDPHVVAKTLAPLLGSSSKDLFKRLTSGSGFVWLQRKVPPKVVEKIELLGLEGLGFSPETKRSYPKRSLACHTLGFVGVDGQGLEGIELKFDAVLRGVDGWRRLERDAHQRALLPLTRKVQEPSGGKTVVLTIDEVLQHIVEQALDTVYKTTEAQSAVCIVQDPSTGEILAMACRPDFDLNNYRAYPVANRRNRAITDAFEPGSCLKVVPTTALLQERLVDPSEVIYCENGAMRLHGHTIHDFRPHGNLTFEEVISESSNIGTIKAASRLSNQQLYECYKLFGFGQRTGLGFPGEARGLLRHPARWSGLSLASISIGQEVSVTPIQLVRAFSAIANDGIMMKPLLVRQTEEYAGGPLIERFSPRQQGRVMSRATARQVKELLHKVVRDGSGGRAAVDGYGAAGKTGTAQKIDPKTGLYQKNLHVAIFCGFVPVDKPRLTIMVLVDSPRVKMDTGGAVAAPVFSEIAEAGLNYLRVPPDDPETVVAKRETVEIGETAAETKTLANPDDVSSAMPDLTGMSKLEVIQALSCLSLELSCEGTGRVVWQSLAPGRSVAPGAECRIMFAKDGVSDGTFRFTQAGRSELH